MAANRDHQGAALWRIGVVTALLVGLLAGLGAGAPAGMRLRITAQHGQLSVDVHQADIRAVLAQIGAQAGVRIVWAQPAAREVSAQFSGVELDAGLRHLLRLASLSYLVLYGQGPTGAPVVHEVRVYGGEAGPGEPAAAEAAPEAGAGEPAAAEAAPEAGAGEPAAAAPDPEATGAPGPARDHPFRQLRERMEALASRAAAEAPRKAPAWPEHEVVNRLRAAFKSPQVKAPPEDQGQDPPDATTSR
jgi:hypothetical protein